MSLGAYPGSAPRKGEGFLPPPPQTETSADVTLPTEPADVRIVTGAPDSLAQRPSVPAEKPLHLGLLSVADQAVASATNFATGIILARTSSREELGLYMLGFSIILLAIDLQTNLIATPYMVFSPRLNGREHALYTGSTLVHQVAFSLLLALGLVCGALASLLVAVPPGLGTVLWALAGVIALVTLREYARRLCFARLKLLTAFVFDSCIAVAQIGGLLLLARFRLLTASRAYWAIGLACGAALIWWFWRDRASCMPRLDDSLLDLKKNWVFGKWVFASGLVWTLGMNLYPWFLAAFHGTAVTGVWAACFGVVSVGNPALLGIQNFVGPKIAHEYATAGPQALRSLVFKITAGISLPVSVLCLALILWGGRLMPLLYGHQYAGNNRVVAVLSLSVLISAPAFCFSRALYASERADLDFLASLAALFVMIFLGLWLVRAFGAMGAAYGLLAGNFVTSALKAGAYLKIQPCRAAPAEELS